MVGHRSFDVEVREAYEVWDAIEVRADFATARMAAFIAGQIKRKERELLNLKSHARNTPTPSAPGEPPARISGHLRDSVESRVIRAGFGKYIAEAGPTAVYAAIQEFGGTAPQGHYIPARPYVRPAVEHVFGTGIAERAIQREWSQALGQED